MRLASNYCAEEGPTTTCAEWNCPSGEDHADPAQVSTAPGLDSSPRDYHTGFDKVKAAYQRTTPQGSRLKERLKKDTEAAQRHRGRRLIAL